MQDMQKYRHTGYTKCRHGFFINVISLKKDRMAFQESPFPSLFLAFIHCHKSGLEETFCALIHRDRHAIQCRILGNVLTYCMGCLHAIQMTINSLNNLRPQIIGNLVRTYEHALNRYRINRCCLILISACRNGHLGIVWILGNQRILNLWIDFNNPCRLGSRQILNSCCWISATTIPQSTLPSFNASDASAGKTDTVA